MNWLFVDMNSYFASVEQHLRPELRGRPVGVIPVESEHTCVIAASYDAKRHGVKTGTRVSDARVLCPGIVLVKAHGMLARLDAHGIQNVRDLWALSKQQAIEVWGSITGGEWWAGFHGHDEPERPMRRRSMSHANVLDPKFRTDAGAYGIMVRLLCRLGARLRSDGYFAQYLRVHLQNVRGTYWFDGTDLPCIQDTPTLLQKFQKLWRRRTPASDLPLKIGVEVAGLTPAAYVPRSLFNEIEKPRDVSMAIDKINQRWGASTVYFGSMHDFRLSMDDKIAFGRIPPTTK